MRQGGGEKIFSIKAHTMGNENVKDNVLNVVLLFVQSITTTGKKKKYTFSSIQNDGSVLYLK